MLCLKPRLHTIRHLVVRLVRNKAYISPREFAHRIASNEYTSVDIFEVIGMAGIEPMYVPKLLNRRMKELAIQVDVHLINGVEINPTPIIGQTLNLGLNGLIAEFDERLPALQKIMLRLRLVDGMTEDIYATIGQVTAPAESGERWLGELTFTTIGKQDEARLKTELDRLA